MNFISLDLELEQPKTRPDTTDSMLDSEKIIQVGFVVYSVLPFEIIERHCYNINIGVPISAYIKKLTGISDEDILKGISIEEAYSKLKMAQDVHKTSRTIVQWGSGDVECLKKELDQQDWIFGRSGLNIKHVFQMYCMANGRNPSGGLKKSMNKLGLKFDGSAHNALVDAENTARVHSFFMDKLHGLK